MDATNLRELRNQRGLSQEALGYLAGIAHTTVGRIERGLVVPERRTIVLLARALRVSTRDLAAVIGNGKP